MASGGCPPWRQLRTQASTSLMQNCSCRASTSLLKVAQGWLPPRYKSPSNHSPKRPLKRGESWHRPSSTLQTCPSSPWPRHDCSALVSSPLKPVCPKLLRAHTLPLTGFQAFFCLFVLQYNDFDKYIQWSSHHHRPVLEPSEH